MTRPPRRFGPPPGTRSAATSRTPHPNQGWSTPRQVRVPNAPGRRNGRERPEMALGLLHHRARAGFVAVCLLFVVIAGRLVQLQGFDHHNYADAAAEQRTGSVELNALRGSIVDRNGTVLAYTTNAQDITVDPKILRDAGITGDKITRYADQLAPLVGMSSADVAKVLTAPGEYGVLAQSLEPLAAKKVSDLDLIGIYSQPTTIRQYPGQRTAANVIGLVHSDGSGAAGIEAEYNSVLAGVNGYLDYTTDGNQNINPNGIQSQSKAINGGTVALTLDQNLQFMVQQYADAAVRESGARGADVVVESVKTGQVLAMASSDTFNSADPSTLKSTVASNPSTMTPFEPGSVNKIVTFAAALEKGVVTPSSVIDVPPYLKTGGVVVHDAWAHPDEQFTATGVLAESSNIGTVEVADKIGPQTWYDYEKAFGIGTATGIELPGESAGYLPAMNTWSDSTFANVPFGQGLSMTALQLAGMYQTIANDGVRIPPRIVSSVTKSDGSVTATKQPAGVTVVSPQTAKTLRVMLESTMLPGGTGTKAAITSYRVAGKTGTAQQPDPNRNGAYSDTLNWDTFAGIVPADNPQFVVSIMVDAPAHGLEGGDVAAPLFHQIATYELQHAGIPPTGSLSTHVPLQVCTEAMKKGWQSNVC